ncbi:hypothetical protein CMI37_08105 [Candidatus Pacearchaeota archaeon]|nr:hypothetical protein [Candidatus Pacearchaeota archaeon]|tara:strand:+ start:3449 stop:4075 length:627 start_codon:yes stop_codon:yes gene_type:complete
MKTKKTKTLFFDFDGTIVDSKEAYYDAMEENLEGWGLGRAKMDKVIDFGFSLKKTLRKLGFSWVNTWILKKKIMDKVRKRVNEVKKCKDSGVIKGLGGRKILVSNSLKEFIMPVIKHLKLKGYFSEIYGADDFDDKAEFLKDYIKKKKLDEGECYYIGDRVRDVEVARKAGCRSVIVSNKCSWDSQGELKRAKPDFLIRDLDELRKLV